ncbi:SELM protein, partial [Polypterus senegalus]
MQRRLLLLLCGAVLLTGLSAYQVDPDKLKDLARGKVERIPLSDMTRTEINELLQSLGFYKKESPDAAVPEEFRFAPAKDSPWRKQDPDLNGTTGSRDPSSPSNEETPELRDNTEDPESRTTEGDPDQNAQHADL